MLRYRLSDAAQADVIDILVWTHERFGHAARLRYESLIVAALRDVATQPDRPGSIARPELGSGVRSWHLRLSRDHAASGADVVRGPHHFLVYRLQSRRLVVGRILHDAMELAQHLDPIADGAHQPTGSAAAAPGPGWRASGSSTVNCAPPPSALAALRLPPCCSTMP